MYTAAGLLRDAKEALGERLVVNWRYFCLEQVNSKEGPEWKVWEQPKGYQSRGLLAFWAGEAARQQGRDAFDRFHWALLRARHEEKRDIADKQVVMDIAAEAGLDIGLFRESLEDPKLLQNIGKDHTHAVEQFGVFGTPTLVFPNGQTAFLKMRPPPPKDEAASVLQALYALIVDHPNIQEIKRPVPPQAR